MSETSDKIINKIRALKAQAEHENTTQAEAEAFAAKAAQMMAEHNVAERQVRPGTTYIDHEVGKSTIWIERGPYHTPRSTLMSAIAANFCCASVYSTWRAEPNEAGRLANPHTLYGTEQNRAMVTMLFGVLEPQMARLAKQQKAEPGGSTLHVRASWMRGFGQGVRQKLTDQNRTVDDERDGTYLPILKSEMDRTKDALNEAHPRLESNRAADVDYGALAAGMKAGMAADVGGGSGITAGGRQALGSGV